jgi:glycosyltransferase involved in cell wall biosynthesis
MNSTITPNIVDALPQSFAQSDTMLALFHLQGSVDAGYNLVQSEIYDNLSIANYTRVLGGKENAKGVKLPDNGGQTAADLERLQYSAQTMPSLMFAMNGDVNSTEPLIVEHAKQGNETGYVVYLPFSIFKEAGISGKEDFIVVSDEGTHFVPKEETMHRYETVYPLMAEAAANFIKEQIAGYENKNIILDANYIDAGQTVLHTQELLKPDMQQGDVVSLLTPHTLGINKLNSLLKNAITNIEYRINETGADADTVASLKETPLLQAYRDVARMMADDIDPKLVADKIEDYINTQEKADIQSFMDSMSEAGIRKKSVQNISVFLKEESLSRLVQDYASIERMRMESGENLKKFDGLMAVSPEMQTQMQEWTDHQVPNHFVLNGFNSDIFNPDVFKNVEQDAITKSIISLYDKAYEPLLKSAFQEGLQRDGLEVDAKETDKMFAAAKQELLEQRTKGTTFIAVSRPDERKGSDLTLDSFGEYVARTGDKDATLVLISHKPSGEFSPMDVTLQNAIQRYDIGGQVMLLPQLQAQDVRTLYELPKAVGLAPSLNEPWGIVAIEQVGAGVPIIASSKYNSAKYVAEQQNEDNQTIITFSSPSEKNTNRAEAVEQFSAAMEEMATNYDKYKSHTAEQAKNIIDEFQWKSTTDVYLDFSKELITKAKFNSAEHGENQEKTTPDATISEVSTQERLQPQLAGRTKFS